MFDLCGRWITQEQMNEAFLQSIYDRYGGKEAYEARMAAERAAREDMPKAPDLKELLAMLWSARHGEVWGDLTEVERHVRVAAMDSEIRSAANPHYHQ